jgi:hypothetical protein
MKDKGHWIVKKAEHEIVTTTGAMCGETGRELAMTNGTVPIAGIDSRRHHKTTLVRKLSPSLARHPNRRRHTNNVNDSAWLKGLWSNRCRDSNTLVYYSATHGLTDTLPTTSS